MNGEAERLNPPCEDCGSMDYSSVSDPEDGTLIGWACDRCMKMYPKDHIDNDVEKGA